MQVYRYDSTGFSREDAEFFKEMVPYLSEYVRSVFLLDGAIEIQYDGVGERVIEEKVLRLAGMLKTDLRSEIGSHLEVKSIFDSTDVNTLNTSDIYENLVKSGQAICLNSGSYALSGLLLQVKKYFELRIDELAESVFGQSYTTIEMPDLIPVAEYEKGGYFDTFPHHIMFTSALENDIEVISQFSEKGTRDRTIFEHLKVPGDVLRTAACMPLYPILEGTTFKSETPGSFVASGHCFRNEERNVRALERLNEFSMKELVQIGDPGKVEDFISKASCIWRTWQHIFGLNMRIDTANDSFFASNYRKLKLFQLLGDSKVECRWLIPADESYIACSSANLHRTHFTKTYNIRTEESGGFCHSACLAFGLERLSYALLSQLGLKIENWPRKAREEIERLVNLPNE